MRLSRPCFDKPHRCPGWAGGGHKCATVDRCPGHGSISTRVPYPPDPDTEDNYQIAFMSPAAASLRFGHCDKCDVVTLPYAIRWLYPSTYTWRIKYTYNGVKDRVTFEARYFGYHVVYRAVHPRRYRSQQLIAAATADSSDA